MLGTAYTPYASGITITSGGDEKTTGGGSGNPILTFTSALAGTGRQIATAMRIDPSNTFFILLPPSDIISRYPSDLRETTLLSLFLCAGDSP